MDNRIKGNAVMLQRLNIWRSGRPILVSSLAIVLLAAALAMPAAIAALTATDPSPAQGHAEVIAQGSAVFDSATTKWTVNQETLDATGDTLSLSGPGFAIATDGSLLISEDEDQSSRLAAGESVFLPGTLVSTATNLSNESTSFGTVVLSDAKADAKESAPVFSSESFDSPDGERDLNLIRDVLKQKESSKITNSDFPALIYAQTGELTVKNSNGGTVELKANQFATLTESLTITATGKSGATFYVAVIGPEIGFVESTTTPETAAGTAEAIAGATIGIATYLCPAGVSIEAATPDTCGNETGLGSGTFELTGDSLEGGLQPKLKDEIWLWEGLAPGDYVVTITGYPDGYSTYAIDLDPAATHIDADLVVTVADSTSNVQVNVYFVEPGA